MTGYQELLRLILEEQRGFRRGMSNIDNTFTLKQIVEKRIEFNAEMEMEI